MTCNHPTPELCHLLGRHVSGRLLEIWNGNSGLPPRKEQMYREMWIERAGYTIQNFPIPIPGTQKILPGPSLFKKATNLSKAVVQQLKDPKYVSEEEKQRRLKICRGCEYFNPKKTTCQHKSCGCFLKIKAGWKTTTCPKGKWELPVIKEQQVPEPEESEPVNLHPIAKHVTKFAVGVTTAPRKEWTLGRCVRSILDTGFDDIMIFAEPDAMVKDLPTWQGVEAIRRPATIAPLHAGLIPAPENGRFGCWQNSVQVMADLLARSPDAQAIVIFQDDAVFCKGIREFLEHDLWPSPHTGLVSIYGPRTYEGDPFGCRSINGKYLMGAVANVYPAEVVKAILNHPVSTNWRGVAKGEPITPHKKKAYDTWAGHAIAAIGKKPYFYTPSLAQHFAKHSALGHGGNEGKRSSLKFLGEETNVNQAFEGKQAWPKVRFELNGKRRYKPLKSKPIIRVVIPAVNSSDLTTKCLSHLASNNWPMIVDYVDNGSEPHVPDVIKSHADSLKLDLTVHRFETNQGFTPAVNLSMDLARQNKQPFLIMNNDCFVASDTIEKLYRAMYLSESVACVGPMTCDRGHQSIRKDKRLKQAGLAELPGNPSDVDTVSKSLNKSTVSPETMLAFFCTLISPAALARIGNLPANYQDGLGADDIWCAAARRRKMTCELVHDAYAFHMHSETFRRTGMDRNKLQKEAMKKIKAGK